MSPVFVSEPLPTLGGALAHADPSQDPPPSLMALDARGVRSIESRRAGSQHRRFFCRLLRNGVGARRDCVRGSIVPEQPANSGAVFLKFLPQTHDDYATVAVAARVTLDGDQIAEARIALGAAAATPLRATVVEDALQGQQPTGAILQDAAALVADVVDPTEDFRGSVEYKRDMAVVWVKTRGRASCCPSQAAGSPGMNFEHQCSVPVARATLWEFLNNIPEMAGCVPGASNVAVKDDGEGEQYTGQVRVKVGPIGLTLQGVMTVQERVQQDWRIVSQAEAKEPPGGRRRLCQYAHFAG